MIYILYVILAILGFFLFSVGVCFLATKYKRGSIEKTKNYRDQQIFASKEGIATSIHENSSKEITYCMDEVERYVNSNDRKISIEKLVNKTYKC